MADADGRLLYTQEHVEDIANAIRALLATDDKMLVSDMADKLSDVRSNPTLFIRSYVSGLKKKHNIVPSGLSNYTSCIFPNGNFTVAIGNEENYVTWEASIDSVTYGELHLENSRFFLGRDYEPLQGNLFFPIPTKKVGDTSQLPGKYLTDGIEFGFTPLNLEKHINHWGIGNLFWNIKVSDSLYGLPGSRSFMDFKGSHPIIKHIYGDGSYHELIEDIKTVPIKTLVTQEWYNLPKVPISIDFIATSRSYKAFNISFDGFSKLMIEDGVIKRPLTIGYTNSEDINFNGGRYSSAFKLNKYTESLPIPPEGTVDNFKSLVHFHTYPIGDFEANCSMEDFGAPLDASKSGTDMEEVRILRPLEGQTDFEYEPDVESNYLFVTIIHDNTTSEKEFTIETSKSPIISKDITTAAGGYVNLTFARFNGTDKASIHYGENCIDGNGCVARTCVFRLTKVNTLEELYSKTYTNKSMSLNLLKDKTLVICIASSTNEETHDPYIKIESLIAESERTDDISYIISKANEFNTQIKVFITDNAEDSTLTVSALGDYSLSSMSLFNILG